MPKPKYARKHETFELMRPENTDIKSRFHSVYSGILKEGAEGLQGGELIENEVRYILPTKPVDRRRKHAKK